MKESHGRSAESPEEIPPSGWWQIVKRVYHEISRDRVSLISAGVAFYMMVALVPTIGTVIALYSLVSDPSDVQEQMVNLRGVVPPDALALINTELTQLVERESVAGWGLAISLLITLWGASKAMDALITALNIAYSEPDSRNFVTRKLVGLWLTAAAVIFFVVVVLGIAALPAILAAAGIDSATEKIVILLRWPILFVSAVIGLAILYRFAPARKNARWRWITPGSIFAASIWVLASIGLSWYVSNFGDFGKAYGSLGAVVLLLLWFYLTGFIVMVGAEINAETELQTARDTTTGPAKPMGKRGAFVADHVAFGDEKPPPDPGEQPDEMLEEFDGEVPSKSDQDQE